MKDTIIPYDTEHQARGKQAWTEEATMSDDDFYYTPTLEVLRSYALVPWADG